MTPKPQTTGGVGDTITVTVGGLPLAATTLNSVKVLPGDEYNQPGAGKEYVMVNVTIKNVGTERYDYNPLFFNALAPDGTYYSTDMYGYSQPGALSSGTLDAGSRITGSIVFQVVKSEASQYMLAWQPTYSADKGFVKWHLGLSNS